MYQSCALALREANRGNGRGRGWWQAMKDDPRLSHAVSVRATSKTVWILATETLPYWGHSKILCGFWRHVPCHIGVTPKKGVWIVATCSCLLGCYQKEVIEPLSLGEPPPPKNVETSPGGLKWPK